MWFLGVLMAARYQTFIPMTFTFDLSSWELTGRLLVPWGNVQIISLFPKLFFVFRVRSPYHMGQTDGQYGRTGGQEP